jgi:nitrate/nitrite transport system ATP-binding protein
MKKYLDIWELSKAFETPKGPAVIVKDFNLALKEGEFVSLIGHSGCGKSTVLAIVAGLSEATSGTVILAGREVRGPGTDRGVVFQAPCLFAWMSALGNVMLGVEQAFPKLSRKEQQAIATENLCRVGLEDALHKRPSELSQGMRQRVGLARAFALEPKMLLLDEPFGMLDSLTRFELQSVDEALFLSDRVVMMTSGPEAKVGDVLEIPFERPRDRTAVLEHPRYYELREHLIGFLEGQLHEPEAKAKEEKPTPSVVEAA